MLKFEIMDLAVEFKKLQKSQEQILEMLKQSNTEKKELKVYSLDELAAFFGVTKRTLYNWKDEGKLPLIIVGSKSYMTEAQLQTFLSKNEVKPFNNRRF
ncbi:DNA binding domain-containing protein, excisionase family [Draconibacterium orientale]|uniref:DNA binding domain-containing protein, excisionase family n=2 Tax=Draconibacterium orientale TaxID=1168034 RepID=A0A1I0H635_9BACT|nr:DNA binding domain-containing protein, excisionase family [Draconibacterium orientale]